MKRKNKYQELNITEKKKYLDETSWNKSNNTYEMHIKLMIIITNNKHIFANKTHTHIDIA